jgi:ppGpp synthetase/RelA/SpoT-type nucleotidyltranferase
MMTRSQIERLGARLVRSDPPAAQDLGALQELLLAYGDALEEAVARVQDHLGMTPSSRVKTIGTILEKLERYGGSWLKSIQDLGGMRIVGSFDRRGQDEVVAQVVELFSDGDRLPRVVDRRREPSHGYRAVHVIVFIRSLPVELQVRTELQHEWAELFEKLADQIGRGIRYGEPPRDWLTPAEGEALSPADREVHDLTLGAWVEAVRVAQLMADAIAAYELTEIRAPGHEELPEVRAHIDESLAGFTRALNLLAALGQPAKTGL